MVAWQFPAARCIGLEAQSVSAEMARRSVAYNVGVGGVSGGSGGCGGCGEDCRVRVLDGDIRDLAVAEGRADGAAGDTLVLPPLLRSANRGSATGASSNEAGFELVTGTPPYFTVSPSARDAGAVVADMGSLPTEEQAAPARYELRGGIEAYCLGAAASLTRAARGRFVVCEGWLPANAARVADAARAAALVVLRRVEVLGRVGKPPLFAVYVMRRARHGEGPPASAPEPAVERLVVRDAAGERTPEYDRLLLEMGIPP